MTAARSARRITLTLALFATYGLGSLALMPLSMAQDRGPVQRTLDGKVLDKSGAPIKGAIVYLKDGRTSQVRSAISLADGSFRFVQLTQNTDYELWAQIDNRKSKTRSISSFDSRNNFTFNLQID
jgi:Carboxypeptidase regulatory-like domain